MVQRASSHRLAGRFSYGSDLHGQLESLSIGRPEKILLSKNHMFVGYGDESTIGARPGELECNIVAVFSRDGQFEFGLDEIFSKDNYKGTIIELNAGYTFRERMVFNAYSADYLWTLDPRSKICKRFHVSFETTLINVLSGDDKHAVAILNYSAPSDSPYSILCPKLRPSAILRQSRRH